MDALTNEYTNNTIFVTTGLWKLGKSANTIGFTLSGLGFVLIEIVFQLRKISTVTGESITEINKETWRSWCARLVEAQKDSVRFRESLPLKPA